MSRFMNETISDLRGGRETWRVLFALGGPAFFIAVATTLARF
jgi:hypothetical protein